MNRFRLSLLSTLCAAMMILVGCISAPQPSIKTHSNAGGATLGIDPRDYNRIAKQFYESLVESQRIPKGSVLALGPVHGNLDHPYHFDARKLQEKIQVRASRSGRLDFCYAVDAMRDQDAAAARYKVMKLQFEKEHTVDSEDLRTFGRLADIDYLVFGRISSHKASKVFSREVTYTFNWKLGNCETGLIEWSDEAEFSKSNL